MKTNKSKKTKKKTKGSKKKVKTLSKKIKKTKVTKKIKTVKATRVGKKPKVIKKKTRKTKKAKKVKKVEEKLINMEEVYRLINRVQVNKKEVTFSIDPLETVIVSNLLKDANVKYAVKEFAAKTTFWLYPTSEEEYNNEEEDMDVDFFEDEILERGQLF